MKMSPHMKSCGNLMTICTAISLRKLFMILYSSLHLFLLVTQTMGLVIPQ